jgi:hormone-sensitive lipase
MYSPSYLYSLNDKILGHTILGICIHSYSLNPATQLMKDPFMSPILLSDEIIAKFPPTRILCGTKDPLVDCSWRFASRLL